MRAVLALLLAVGVWWGGAVRVAPAQAQTGLEIEVLQIELWPEFDRAAMLVLLTGTLAPGTNLPAQVEVRIPAAAGEPHAVAYQSAEGSLLTAPFTTRTEGESVIVTLTSETLTFHLEYYDPALTISGEVRSYAFDWTPSYAVRAAKVRIQHPVDSREVALLPAASGTTVGDYGLTYSVAELGALIAGQPVALTLSYQKSGGTLSSTVVNPPLLQAEPVTSPSAATTDWTPWIIGGASAGAVAIVLGLGWFVWQRRQARTPVRRARPGRRQAAARAEADPAEPRRIPTPAAGPAGRRFCTQCGEPITVSDNFCRNCGARAGD